MEALGAAATIVQLVSFTAEVLALGYGYLAKAKRAPSEIRTLMREVTYINELLEQLEELASEDEADNVKTAIKMMEDLGTFDDCSKMVLVVQKCLTKCQQIEGQQVRNIGKRLLWPFQDKQAKETLLQLAKLRETLSAAVQVDSSKSLSRLEVIAKSIDRNGIRTLKWITTLQDDMTDLKLTTVNISTDLAFMKSIHENEIMQKQNSDIRRWLRLDGIESEARYRDALSQRNAATGSWILTSSAFLDWIQAESSCLWLYGIAGCGKTVLVFVPPFIQCSELTRSRATIIDYLQRDVSLSASSAVVYFFCDHRDPTKRSLNDLLRVLIKQLLEMHSESFTEINLWRREKMLDPSIAASISLSNTEYIELTRKICAKWASVRLIVDAVDECEDLRTFVPGLAALVDHSNISVVLTSRHDVDLVRAIDPLARYRIPVVENMRGDIHQYLARQIRTRIEGGLLKLRDKNLEVLIVTELEKKADGMILIAKLHLDYICRLKSDRAIKEALAKLPSDIYPTYDEILLQICAQRPDDIDNMRSILQWLLYTIVPLTLDQIGEIISIRPEDTKLDKSGIATDLLDLAASLGSLVTLNELDTSGKMYDDLRGPKVTLITLAHSSVEEYLKSGKMMPGLAERFSMSGEEAQASLAKLCLQYIAFDDFADPIVKRTPGKSDTADATEEYASKSPKDRGIYIDADNLSDISLPDFQGRPRFEAQTATSLESSQLDPKQSGSEYQDAVDNKPEYSVPQTLPALTFKIESKAGGFNIPLSDSSYESDGEHGETEEQKTAFDEIRNERLQLRERTSEFAFYDYACRYWLDHLSKSKLSSALDAEISYLLDWFLNFASQPGKYTSWQQMYHRDIVYFCPGRPPLHYAIEFQIESLVALLKPAKQDIDNLICGVSALHVAARCGAYSIVQNLLDDGASVDLRSAKDPKGMTSMMTPLHFAAECGRSEVIKLLLKHGASPHATNESGTTPFFRAARSGSLKAMKVLYDAGSDVNNRKTGGLTPLFEAVSQCRPKIACQLLQWGADPTILKDGRFSTLSLLRIAQNAEVLKNYVKPDSETRKHLYSQFTSNERIHKQIIEILAQDTPGGSGFMVLMKGLKRQWMVLKQMEKDTRPGTEREKDSRYPLDISKIITIAEFLDKDDDGLTEDTRSRP